MEAVRLAYLGEALVFAHHCYLRTCWIRRCCQFARLNGNQSFPWLVFLVTSLLGTLIGVILARIFAELLLVLFSISEHLAAIRNQRTILSEE